MGFSRGLGSGLPFEMGSGMHGGLMGLGVGSGLEVSMYQANSSGL